MSFEERKFQWKYVFTRRLKMGMISACVISASTNEALTRIGGAILSESYSSTVYYGKIFNWTCGCAFNVGAGKKIHTLILMQKADQKTTTTTKKEKNRMEKKCLWKMSMWRNEGSEKNRKQNTKLREKRERCLWIGVRNYCVNCMRTTNTITKTSFWFDSIHHRLDSPLNRKHFLAFFFHFPVIEIIFFLLIFSFGFSLKKFRIRTRSFCIRILCPMRMSQSGWQAWLCKCAWKNFDRASE